MKKNLLFSIESKEYKAIFFEPFRSIIIIGNLTKFLNDYKHNKKVMSYTIIH